MSPNRLSNLTIVIVEDHNDARAYLGLFLERLGATVVAASNAFEGIEAVKNSRPNLVIRTLIQEEISLPWRTIFPFRQMTSENALGMTSNTPVRNVVLLAAHTDYFSTDSGFVPRSAPWL
jgi:CheY-like chemotaxis protein